MRLITAGSTTYDSAVVLTPRRSRAGARALARDLGRCGVEAEVVPLELPDPSDHAALFAALGPVIEGLPDERPLDVVLSAGTPQAQTLWVILVCAGLLDARMLQVIPPRFVPDLHPEPVREVRLDIEGFPEIKALREEVVRLRARVSTVTADLVGDTEAMRRLARRLARVAATDVPVLVLGETGTGKERVARAIHAAGPRRDAPFVAENCGAFAEGVLQSELFGHEPGAFTGAAGRRRGLFEQAHGGTLFLDEVGEMPLSVQVRLLRTLQEGTIRRVGGEGPVEVDVRMIAATHRDLRAMVAAKQFREDLYYRLRGAVLEVPPLRDRLGDLEALVRLGLRQNDRDGLRPTRRAWAALHRWHWPGNVRELLAEVRRWTVFCDDVVDVEDLSPEIRRAAALPQSASQDAAAQATDHADGIPPSQPANASLAAQVEAVERRAIVAALAESDGRIAPAARQLGIDRNTLKRKMSRFGLR